ncbi:MAG: Ig-like domain-containing protein, partial [Terracidiphilus sp.]
SCDATITWSLTAGSTGTLTSAGLYTAPSAVSSQQTVTVSAVSQSNGASLGSAQVTLLPAPQPLTLVASSPSPYQVGSSQTFTATLLDQQGNPLTGVTVNFTVAGPNETVGSVTTNASGTASFTYTGSNSGTDTLQATASVDGALLTSNSLTATWLAPPPAQAPTLTLLPQTSPGRGALMGAFTDNNGDVIEPIVIGTATRTFITPSGATRLQLGIDDTYYEQNGGAGFVVQVNGVNVTVPPTAMPWNWTTGSLNNNYQYGVSDGSSPVIAASSLIAGQPVTVSYQSGTISTNYPVNPLVDANGENGFVTGTQLFNGTYFPTLYTTGAAYPQNQPINVFATVVDASGAPIPNTPVTLTISGANAGQYQATTDATGTASFLYTGQYAGNDSLQAQATLAGQGGTLESNLTTIDWTNYPTPPPVGSLSLYYIVSIVNDQRFTVLAKDASGNVLPNVSVGCYVTGIESSQTSSSTNNLGEAGCGIYHNQSSSYGIFAVDTVDRNVLVTQPYTGNWTVPTGSPSATGGTITVGISADTTVTMPNSLQLTGTVTDNSGLMPTVAWTQVSGPGTVAFAAPNQASTTATFSQVGTYVLQLSANDTVNSGFAQFTVTVLAPSVASQAQGWIGAPKYGSSVSGVVPITLA